MEELKPEIAEKYEFENRVESKLLVSFENFLSNNFQMQGSKAILFQWKWLIKTEGFLNKSLMEEVKFVVTERCHFGIRDK